MGSVAPGHLDAEPDRGRRSHDNQNKQYGHGSLRSSLGNLARIAWRMLRWCHYDHGVGPVNHAIHMESMPRCRRNACRRAVDGRLRMQVFQAVIAAKCGIVTTSRINASAASSKLPLAARDPPYDYVEASP